MARPFDDDSGVLASRELSPSFSSYDQPADRSPFWAPTGRSVTAPHAAQPAAWSPYGTWSSNGKTVPPRYPTVGMGIKRRPRWILRFFVFVVLVGAGAVLLRKQLPPFPRSIGEAARLWDQGKAWVKGKTGNSGSMGSVSGSAPSAKPVQVAAATPAATAPKPVTPPAATTARARGPEIVPMPALPSAAPVARAMPARVGRAHRDPLAAMPARPRRRGLLARVRTTSARGTGASALAAVPFNKAAARPAGDPFEDGAAPAPARAAAPAPARVVEEVKTEKPEPVAAEAPEPPPARPAPRPRPEPPAPRAAAPDSLDALMATAVGHPVKRSGKGELDRKLASADEEAPPAPRKKVEAPPAHALTRSEIQAVMAGVQAKVGECYRKFHVPGAADVKIAVAEDGSVNTVQLTGPVAGTPSGACVEKAVENAAFPASSGLRFDYRLQLR